MCAIFDVLAVFGSLIAAVFIFRALQPVWAQIRYYKTEVSFLDALALTVIAVVLVSVVFLVPAAVLDCPSFISRF